MMFFPKGKPSSYMQNVAAAASSAEGCNSPGHHSLDGCTDDTLKIESFSDKFFVCSPGRLSLIQSLQTLYASSLS
jgi:hypothetical protein